jgi:hypothetical protein
MTSAPYRLDLSSCLTDRCRRVCEPGWKRKHIILSIMSSSFIPLPTVTVPTITFGLDGAAWNEDLVLQRYELLYEAVLVKESPHTSSSALLLGDAMHHDHRRILATGMARLRAKIKYRPVVFELMPPTFTLLQLQVAVEALAGRGLHKQNFRRLIE